MELRHLRYFVIVAEEQNVTRAAERLHVSQPPLSRQIRDLEHELGVELFRRTGKSLALTEAGKIFLIEARAVLLRVDKAIETVRTVAHGDRGSLRIGYAPSLTAEFLPRALFERFNLEVLATTDSPIDSLADHQAIRDSGWDSKLHARILPTFRPDPVVDPEFTGFGANIAELGRQTGENTFHWDGYLQALRTARTRFRSLGCTASDHGHPTAQTADLSAAESETLFNLVLSGNADAPQHELFRAQMLTEMARMSLDDGLVMQIHPGSVRNHNHPLYLRYGRDIGADIPQATSYVHALRPLLNLFGNEPGLTIILFTLDETAYSRELAPLAGHYPCLRLGPPWWFHDSPEGMMRFRELATETAGFYNTVGFNDDTRAFLSSPARHDVARRMDCSFLAKLVAEHRLAEDEAFEVALDLTYRLVKKAYRL